MSLPPTPYALGRLPEFDERSRAYPARALLGAEPVLRDRKWRRGNAYNQGQLPWCVAYTGKGLLNTAPLSAAAAYYTRSHYSVANFYDGAQANDQWPGNNYDGTSGLGLAKYLLARGLIKSYHWNFSLEDTLLTLANVGPVGIGVKWRSHMWDTDSKGFLDISGDEEGGHETELLGLCVKEEYVWGCNSWSTGWGLAGQFKVHFDDLGNWLADDGDSLVLVA
jgi:hypothetical protein